MINTGRRLALIAALVALPLAVTGCSSSKSSGSGQSANAPVGGAAVTSGGSGGATGGTSGGTSGGGDGGGKFSGACSLISADQAKTALGDDVSPGVQQSFGGGNGTSCTFDGAGDGDDVVVEVGPIDFIRQAQGTHQTQAVSGIGDEAHVYGLGADIYAVYVGKGATAIDISISKDGKGSDPETLPPQPVADALTSLAKTAVGKI